MLTIPRRAVFRANDFDMSSDEGKGVGLILNPSCLVPDGRYEARYRYYETQVFFSAPKVAVHFSIINHDNHAGTEIARYYTVKNLSGPPRKYGDFEVANPNCGLVREFGRVVKKPERLDRISYASLKGKRILVQTRTVLNDSKGKPLGEDERYSTIAELLCTLEEEPD